MKRIIFLIALTPFFSALAHESHFSESVAALMHIEPTDIALAGQTSQITFELTLKGGKILNSKDCKCNVVIYAGKPNPKIKPLGMFSLNDLKDKAVLEFTFPKAGLYTLLLSGQAKVPGAFAPFKFQFEAQAK